MKRKKNIVTTNNLADSKSKIPELIQGTVDWYEKEISTLRKLRDANSTTTKDYDSYNEKIKVLNDELKKLIGSQEKLADLQAEVGSEKWYKELISGLEKQIELLSTTNPLYDDLVFRLKLVKDGYNALFGKETTDDITTQSEAIEVLSMKFNNFLESFSSEAMGDFGFETLNELLQIDEDGITLFQGMIDEIDALPDVVATATEKAAAKFGIYFNAITEVAQEAFNFLQQNQDAYFEKQFYNLEQERDIAIEFAGDSTGAKEEIERQYEERRRAIQAKQAKAQKAQAIFNILLNTAQGVTAALTSIPPNVPLSIAVGVIGAVQTALVASTPVPEFFRGTENAPEGWAKVDEKRPEIHTDRVGNIKSTGEGRANMRWLSAGDKIYSSHEEYFKKEFSGNDMIPYQEMLSNSAPVVTINGGGIKKEDFVREIRAMRNDIVTKESSVVNIDKNGFYTGVKKKGARTERLNNILKLKGGIV